MLTFLGVRIGYTAAATAGILTAIAYYYGQETANEIAAMLEDVKAAGALEQLLVTLVETSNGTLNADVVEKLFSYAKTPTLETAIAKWLATLGDLLFPLLQVAKGMIYIVPASWFAQAAQQVCVALYYSLYPLAEPGRERHCTPTGPIVQTKAYFCSLFSWGHQNDRDSDFDDLENPKENTYFGKMTNS